MNTLQKGTNKYGQVATPRSQRAKSNLYSFFSFLFFGAPETPVKDMEPEHHFCFVFFENLVVLV